jgi:LemA protein
MSYDARIARMRDQGLISEDQAKRLARAIGPQRESGAGPHSPRNGRLFVVLAVVAALIAGTASLWFAAGTPPVNEAPQIAQDVSKALNQTEEIGGMSNSMRGGFSLALMVVVPLLLVIAWVAWLYNSLVTKEELVFESWAQVESNYQRRADLIPNILEAVADYMAFEKETLGAVVGQRSQAGAAVPPEVVEDLRKAIDDLSASQEESAAVLGGIQGAPADEQALRRLADAQAALGTSMHRILALSESYPTLRSSDQVLALQAELEGTENRINVARMRFNEAASDFNAAIRRMPASLIASLGDFRRKAYFTSDAGANRPVDVSLD